jgi:hypothetical protein
VADASKLRQVRRTGLGIPPPPDEARTDLRPDLVETFPRHSSPESGNPADRPNPTIEPAGSPVRIDGRTLRRSGRTIQFATRVSPEFDVRIRTIAQRDGLLIVEVLERALAAYERAQGGTPAPYLKKKYSS